MAHTLFLSNRLEYLVKDLKNNLFQNTSFFSKRILIFPNEAIKEMIYQNLADDPEFQIAFGITPLYLNEALNTLNEQFFQINTKKKKLNHLQLVFKIEESFLGSFKASERLAYLFEKWGLYGSPKPATEETIGKIWDEIFSIYTYPYEWLSSLSEKEAVEKDVTIHLFGFNHLPPCYFHFFERLAKKINVNFYVLSPCLEFWSDIKSDKEAMRFFSKVPMRETLQVTMEEYLEDRHPLLANLGKVGRDFAKLMEESEVQTIEHYADPSNDTALHALQQALLYLKENQNIKDDDSIQIHSLSTRHREIENLYNQVLFYVKEKGIEPKDILVMAPDIAPYVPYISACFEKLPYRILDRAIFTEDTEIVALFQLLALEEKRWSAPTLLSLFSNPLFKKRQNWKDEDLEAIKNWIELGSIRWGVNLEHANRLLSQKFCNTPFEDGSLTWQRGFNRLYKNFALYEEAHQMDLLESELLGEITFLIESLYNDLSPFFDETKKTVFAWIEEIKQLFLKYFSFDRMTLFPKLEIFQKSAFDKEYTFKKLHPLLLSFLSKEKAAEHRHELQSVTFSSMNPMRCTPAKVVCLLGMNQEAFPRKEKLSQKIVSPYFVTTIDEDRYLFLEALLSAREYFIISYVGKSLEDQAIIPESSVVFELLRTIPKKEIIIHPDVSFDPTYFQNKNLQLKNYSQSDFKKACTLFEPKKAITPLIKKENPLLDIPEGEHVININELKRVLRYPISHFLEKNYNLTFYETKDLSDEEAFILPPWHLKPLAQNVKADEILKKLSKKGEAPLSYFKNLALFQLDKSTSKQEPVSLTTIEFSEIEKETYLDEKGIWRRPALKFKYDEKRTFIFVGKIENVGPKALFTSDKCTLPSAVKHWSHFLLLNLSSHGGQSLVFANEKKEKAPFFDDPAPFLKEVIAFYFYAKATPLFIMPEWVEAILEKDKKKLQKFIEEKKIYDEGALFASRRLVSASIDEILNASSDMCERLYKDVKDAWF